ncbi:MAG: MFS transporter [Bacteroidales bacterium]|nr:MFS transporter [Bacteroidales bacterium]
MGKITTTIKQYPRTFWVANTLELFERMAWYGFFMLFANYLTGTSETGALEFTQAQKGWIMGVGTGILYFLPVITGAIADKYGYKKVLTVAFVIYASAFILLPMFTTFVGTFLMYIYLAVGAALFKPVISATIAKTTNESTASIGFGIFYMMVNIGSFIGPLITLFFKGADYNLIFRVSAGVIILNLILLQFYKEPETTRKRTSFTGSMKIVFGHIWEVMLNFRFVVFLIIVAGFWIMYLQLFFTLPVFIAQWVDTTVLLNFFRENIPFVARHYSNGNQLDAEFITNFDALFIVAFQLVVSSVVMRWKALNSMITGIVIASIGMALTVYTQNVLFVLVAMFIFSIGEMAASPKITEYIGNIAPPDKKALYMGYSFIPMFIGNLGAGWISGSVYQQLSDKHTLVLKTIADNNLTYNANWTKQEYFTETARALHLSDADFTQYLWQTFHPNNIWMVVFGIGMVSAILLWVYNKLIK